MQKLTFGDTDLIAKKKHQVRKSDKPTPPPAPEKLCAFQTTIETSGRLMKSVQCKEPALVNGWCLRHQHAQQGLDLGARMGFPGVSVPMGAYVGEEPFLLILGSGEANWRAYFERATGSGLTTVLKYLETKQVGRE